MEVGNALFESEEAHPKIRIASNKDRIICWHFSQGGTMADMKTSDGRTYGFEIKTQPDGLTLKRQLFLNAGRSTFVVELTEAKSSGDEVVDRLTFDFYGNGRTPQCEVFHRRKNSQTRIDNTEASLASSEPQKVVDAIKNSFHDIDAFFDAAIEECTDEKVVAQAERIKPSFSKGIKWPLHGFEVWTTSRHLSFPPLPVLRARAFGWITAPV
jgi:hypothetical protein